MIAYLALAVFPAALIIAAANDVYEFKIPNWICIVLISAFPTAGMAAGAPLDTMVEGALLGAGALAFGFALFAGRVIGGGDAKLIASIAPWIGVSAFGLFLINMAISGLVLAIGMMAFRRLPVLPVYAHAPWLMELHARKKDLPYGVAIAAGGLLTFAETPFFLLVLGG
ncbi:MAG: prepilin peptidase [Pseudomonadota bacterium]